MAGKNFDLIIYGATGYTGKYCVEYLAKYLKQHSNKVKWAIAGRNEKKLLDARTEVAARLDESLDDIPVIVASTENEASLVSMSSQCKVLLNLVGPYHFHGEPVVKACLKTSTHHVDISGEPLFLDRMQLKYNDEAKKSKSIIVGACGFDSIPAEMGIEFLSKHFEKNTVNSVEAFVSASSGVINHGTWDSLINAMTNFSQVKPLKRQLFSQLFPKRFPNFPYKVPQTMIPKKSEDFQRWYIPFWPIDTDIVKRSQAYFLNINNERPIQFTSNLFAPWITYFILLPYISILFLMTRFTFTRNLLYDYPNLFTFGSVSKNGPTRENVLNSSFKMRFVAKGWNELEQVDKMPPNKTVKGMVSGVSPAYVTTSQCLIQSALAILEERDSIPFEGGVFTPAVAFRKTNLIDRLNRFGVSFKLL